jgi:hypothetical protein
MPGSAIGRSRRLPRVPAVLAVLAVLTSVPARSPAAPPDSSPTVTCSFSHSAYSGWCKQTAPVPKDGSGDQVCRDILSCLNDVQCNATYCNATTVRGGWKLESVQVEAGK